MRTGPSRKRRSRAARAGAALGALALGLAAGCGASDEQRRTAATRDPEGAVAEALERAQSEAGVPEEPSAATPRATVPPGAGAPDPPVAGRDDLAIRTLDVPERLSGRYELRRLPSGVTRSGERRSRYPAASDDTGQLDLHVVTFDARDPAASAVIGLDVRIVRGAPRDVAREQQRTLTERRGVERVEVRGREAILYDTGVGSRSLRWVDRRGTMIVLEGLGLSSAALLDLATGVARRPPT